MKDLSDVVALVVDYGSFLSLAERLSQDFKKVLLYTAWEQEYRDLQDCCIGTGIENVRRVDDFLAPEVLDEIDLLIAPDIGYGGLQRHFRQLGKAVWGSMGASDLELFRTRFLRTVEELGLDVPPYRIYHGLTELAEGLKNEKNVWVKINRYRENMETWKHIDWEHSQPMLHHLAGEFGGLKETVTFVVMDDIPDAHECGYDGWCINGQFPESSTQGYEKKNELYLGCVRPYAKLPEPVRKVNEAFGPVLKEYGYCNFWATEIRSTDEGDYFIDPTPRLPGQTGEQLLETCGNLSEIIWHGANGEVVTPRWNHRFAAEATLHYTACTDDGWKVLNIPEQARQWVKLYQYCKEDGLYHFPPHKVDEVGVVIGVGDSVEDSIDNLKEHFALLEEEPLSISLEGFVDLITEINKAEDEGLKFSDQPPPKATLEMVR